MGTPETVRIFTTDEDGDALTGVLVRVFDTGGLLVTEDYSVLVGSDAIADFTLDGDVSPISYTIRMSKDHVAFDGSLGASSKSPQNIDIYSPASGSPTGTNDFDVMGQTFTRPVASDLNMCCLSGFFKDPAGRPHANMTIMFTTTYDPLIVSGDAIAQAKVWGKTDQDGFFKVNLYRNGIYFVDLAPMAEERQIIVPDAPSANLIDVLFPIVASVTYTPATATVTVGSTTTVEVEVKDSTGIVHTASEVCEFITEDDDIVGFSLSENTLSITGLSAGTGEIVCNPLDDSIVTVPAVELASLTVTVG